MVETLSSEETPAAYRNKRLGDVIVRRPREDARSWAI